MQYSFPPSSVRPPSVPSLLTPITPPRLNSGYKLIQHLQAFDDYETITVLFSNYMSEAFHRIGAVGQALITPVPLNTRINAETKYFRNYFNLVVEQNRNSLSSSTLYHTEPLLDVLQQLFDDLFIALMDFCEHDRTQQSYKLNDQETIRFIFERLHGAITITYQFSKHDTPHYFMTLNVGVANTEPVQPAVNYLPVRRLQQLEQNRSHQVNVNEVKWHNAEAVAESFQTSGYDIGRRFYNLVFNYRYQPNLIPSLIICDLKKSLPSHFPTHEIGTQSAASGNSGETQALPPTQKRTLRSFCSSLFTALQNQETHIFQLHYGDISRFSWKKVGGDIEISYQQDEKMGWTLLFTLHALYQQEQCQPIDDPSQSTDLAQTTLPPQLSQPIPHNSQALAAGQLNSPQEKPKYEVKRIFSYQPLPIPGSPLIKRDSAGRKVHDVRQNVKLVRGKGDPLQSPPPSRTAAFIPDMPTPGFATTQPPAPLNDIAGYDPAPRHLIQTFAHPPQTYPTRFYHQK